MEIKQNLSNRSNYGSVRSTDKIKYIVIHYTGNDGDTDEGNGSYFHNGKVGVSAHYFVDSDSVTQSVPDNYVAWSVGGSKYSNCASTGGGKYYGTVTNTNSISIELCDDCKNGTIYPSAATIKNALEWTRTLMNKYGIPKERVIRHFDVTGKGCPAYWCGSAEKDKLWRSEFYDKICATVSNNVSGNPVLTQGSTGEAVKTLQQRLNAWGFDVDVDGSVGPLTWEKLNGEVSVAKFNDTAGHWAKGVIDAQTERGIMQGDGNGNFMPDKPMTRAEFCAANERTIAYMTGLLKG